MTAARTVKIPNCEQEDDFHVKTQSRAKDAEELQKILKAEPPAAIFAEDIRDTSCEGVVQQLINSF